MEYIIEEASSRGSGVGSSPVASIQSPLFYEVAHGIPRLFCVGWRNVYEGAIFILAPGKVPKELPDTRLESVVFVRHRLPVGNIPEKCLWLESLDVETGDVEGGEMSPGVAHEAARRRSWMSAKMNRAAASSHSLNMTSCLPTECVDVWFIL